MKDESTARARPPPWAIRPLVPESVYTDREEPLEYLYKAALDGMERRTRSVVLLGQRRMGKTEIFKRVVNRLFFEQEHHADPLRSVVPVYYSFGDQAMDEWKFSIDYVENFIRWYAAFRLRDTKLLNPDKVQSAELGEYLKKRLPMTRGFEDVPRFVDGLRRKGITVPDRASLSIPRDVSDRDESTIAVFLDEFQNARLPQHGFDVVGMMQNAVESPTCPHFVTGSAMSILGREILGRGALFGRFRAHPIESMTPFWGTQLALRAARQYRVDLPERMAPVVAERCGGNPFYITAVVQQAAEQGEAIASEDALDRILAIDLTSGFIWGELNDQVTRWIERINEYGITKWVLYLSALEEGDRIDLERIRQELKERDGKEVALETIRDVLVKLSRGDLVDYRELGGWFRKMDDPILVDFLKVWGRIEVEGKDRGRTVKALERKYQLLEKRVRDHLGYLGEVYMAQVLWNSQSPRHRVLPGRFFHQEGEIGMPTHWNYIWHRIRLGGGSEMEVDIEAASGTLMWICESKWWRGRKAGQAEVDVLLKKAEMVREKEGEGLLDLKIWFFAHDGFTTEAEAAMKEEGVLWSDRDDLDGLLAHVGLRSLPDL